MVKILKSDNPTRSYAHLSIVVLKKYEMEKAAFKVGLSQLTIEPEIIKITKFRVQILA